MAVLDCIRAMWDLSATDEVWYDSMAETTHPVLASMGGELGLLIIDFACRDDGRIDFATRYSASADVDSKEVVSMVEGAPDYEAMAAFYRRAPWGGTMVEILEREENRDYVLGNAEKMGVGDTLGLLGGDANGGTQVQVMSSSRISLDDKQRWVVTGLTAHLSAAHRLRRDLDAVHADDADAVFSADGELLEQREATNLASHRDRLRTVVTQQRNARDARTLDSTDCLDAWASLVDGRYSIVDVFEERGKRLFLLYENPYFFRSPRALSPGQRDVIALAARGLGNEQIGLSLGVSASTVATDLSQGMRKLGFARRAELVRYLGWEADVVASQSAMATEGVQVLEVEQAEVDLSELTAAEADVAKRVAAGATNAEIARARGTRARTVANQLASVYSKLGVNSRHELTAILGGQR